MFYQMFYQTSHNFPKLLTENLAHNYANSIINVSNTRNMIALLQTDCLSLYASIKANTE